MEMSVKEFIAEKASSGEFYLFLVKGLEWQWIMKKIAEEFFASSPPDDIEDFGLLILPPHDDMLFWARQSMLPVEEVERRFGVHREDIAPGKIFKGKEFPKGGTRC
jgi:hypothetical protein